MLILASSSIRRKELLSKITTSFEVILPQEVVELETYQDIRLLPIINAVLKAKEVSNKYCCDTVLSSDTVILFNGKAIGKPKNLYEAKNTLLELSGNVHEVVSAVSLIRKSDEFREYWSEVSYVKFKKFNEKDVDNYLSKVYVLDKAGSYAIQEHGSVLVEEVCGEIENIVGLPIKYLGKRLKEFGIV